MKATTASARSFEQGVRDMTDENFAAVIAAYRERRDHLVERNPGGAASYQAYIDAFVAARQS